MRGKKVFLDVLLVAAGIVGTLFLVYCSSGPDSTPVSGAPPPTVSIYNENLNACLDEFPPTARTFSAQFSTAMNPLSVSSHVEVAPSTAFSISPNTGPSEDTYALEFPDNLAYSTTYSITVTAGALSATSRSLQSDYTYTFRTKPQGPPVVTRSRPNKNYLLWWPRHRTVSVYFSERMATSSVLDHLVVSSPLPSFSTSWEFGSDEHVLNIIFDEDLDFDTDYEIAITAGAEDEEGETLQSDYTLSFRTEPSAAQPRLTWVSPAPQATGVPRALNDARLIFSQTMSFQSLSDNVTISPHVDFELEYLGNVFDIVFSELLEGDTPYTITIPSNVMDALGNSLYAAVAFSFTTEAESPPFVTGTQPANGETGVDLTIDAVIEFSEFMSESSVQSAFSMTPSPLNEGFSWSQCSDVMTAFFSPALAYSTVYTITIRYDAMDDQGETMGSPHVFSFTTKPLPRPAVIDNYPAHGATNVILDPAVRVHFSKDMDGLSALQAVTISPDPGPVSKVYLPAIRLVEMIFPSGLDPDTEYTVTVAAGAEDTEGYSLASDYTFSFTTTPCAAACTDYGITLDPDQSVYNLDQPLEYTLVSSYEMTPCVEDVDWYYNDVLNMSEDPPITGHLLTSAAGTNTLRAETSGFSDCTVTLDFQVNQLCPSSCSAITFDEPEDSAQFLAGDEFSLVLGGSTACIANVIFSSDADGLLGSGNITSLLTSLSTTATHTITADVISTGMATCELTKNVSVLDCPATCDDISLTEPSSTQYLLGDDVPYALGGNTLCVEDVLWDLTGDSQALTTGLSGTLTGLDPGGYAISADVKSTLLATCQNAFSFTVLPCPSACNQYSMPLPAENEHFSGDTVTFTLEAAGDADFSCADNIIWESDVDGVLDSGQGLNSISVSDLSPDTHTITASIVSSMLATCTIQKTVTILDCPGDCSDITFDLPTESTFNFGNSIVFGLGGMLDCVQNVLWSSDVDGTLGSGPVLTSLSTSALSITVHTITSEVKSYSLATCDKTKMVTILPFSGSNLLPDTGQTTCYDNTHALQASSCPAVGDTFYGQDASYINPPPAISLSANGDSTVTDNNTGLIWQQGYNGGWDHFWQTAVDACDSLSLAGTNSWRLPSRRELMTITDYGTSYPALNTTVFDYLNSWDFYWTSTSSAAAASDAWFVDTSLGSLGTDDKTMPAQLYEAYSRCVLGDPLPAANLTNNGDSTVTDSASNLMWQDGIWATASTITWDEALAYCENLSQGAYTDWKLPDIKELESLVDADSYSPAIDTTAFVDQTNIDEAFWSSTTYGGLALDAWAINFNTGWTRTGTKASMGFKIYVRCVREP